MKVSMQKKITSINQDYLECVGDLLQHEKILEMRQYIQHSDINCLDHCLYVSYLSYLVCKQLGLNTRSAARGGLLHDFFLYDWHITKPKEGLHGFVHPVIALKNSMKHFEVDRLEQDIIGKHMWPLTRGIPRYLESIVVLFVDKYCTIREVLQMKDPVLHKLRNCYVSR
jgi:uncharacterized protein